MMTRHGATVAHQLLAFAKGSRPTCETADHRADLYSNATVTPLSDSRRQLVDTAFRGLLSVALFAAFPAFSDIYRLWRRQAGVVPGELAPEAFEYPPIAALVFKPLTWLPSARWAVVVNGLVMVVAAVAVTWFIQRHTERGLSPDTRLWVASPALLFLLPMNWDVAVALTAVLGLSFLIAQSESKAGLTFGAGFGWKIAPGSLVLPVLPLINGWRRRIAFLFGGGITVIVSYGAYVLFRPDGWQTHLDFASSRTDYQPTIWGGLDAVLSFLGVDLSLTTVNVVSGASVALALIGATAWTAVKRPTFAESAAIAMSLFLLFNKIFKHAYILWLIPLLALAGTKRLRVRILEVAVLVSFAAVFFPVMPQWLTPISAAVRTLVLVFVITEISGRYGAVHTAQGQ